MTRRARVAAWLADRLAGLADPSQLHAADRAALEQVTGRELGPSVPVMPVRRFDTREGVLCASASFVRHELNKIARAEEWPEVGA